MMTREERDAAIAEILGVHAMPWRLAAITAVVDCYADQLAAVAIAATTDALRGTPTGHQSGLYLPLEIPAVPLQGYECPDCELHPAEMREK